jgi:hypothetical protein
MEVKVTKEEILNNPNDYELGRLVRQKYWNLNQQDIIDNPDEHFGLVIGEDGVVQKIIRAEQSQNDEYDKCIICGRETSYKRSTHIDLRVGYIEGAGQTCDGTCRKK